MLTYSMMKVWPIVTFRLIALAFVVAGSAVLAAVVRRRDGRSRAVTGPAARLTPAELGRPLGRTVTFVQFSTTACAPCRGVRRALGELTAGRPDVVHVEVDAEQHLDLVRQHRVFTTPTVLVLDATGAVRHRLTGAVDRRGLGEALSAVAATPATTGAEVHHG